jgi:hypothetical protein
MKVFICDKCKKEFPQPLDEEKYLDEHGEWRVFDLCAPCRKGLKGEEDKSVDTFFKPLIKKEKK